MALATRFDHPAYRAAIQLPKYNGKVTVFQAVSDADGARVLKRANPDWSQEDHLALARLHAAESSQLSAQYSALLDAAAQETFGRPFQVADYRISAIGCAEFSEERKTALRNAAYGKTRHLRLAHAHLKAAGRRNLRRAVGDLARTGSAAGVLMA